MNDAVIREPFVRDRLTWLGYLLIAHSCYTLAALGPAMPFLRAELAVSYTVSAFHFSAWALGGLVAGVIGDKVMRSLGRSLALWGCGAGVSLGILLLIASSHPILTIVAAWISGTSASIMVQAITSVVADRFGAQRTTAIFEGNIIASVSASIAPLVVGFAVRAGSGWRVALCLPVVLFAVLLFSNRRTPIPPLRSGGSRHCGSLPLVYWGYWLVVLLSVAAEWSIIFWSAEFLEHADQLSKADASQVVTAFLAAMFIGRMVGCRLSRSYALEQILPISSIIALAGFLLCWLSHSLFLSIPGLFLAGLGISNFYPLTLSAAIGSAADNSATATARMSISTGLAVLCAPLLLGFIADHTTLFQAYGFIAVYLSVSTVTVVLTTQYAIKSRAEVQTAAEVPSPSS